MKNLLTEAMCTGKAFHGKKIKFVKRTKQVKKYTVSSFKTWLSISGEKI